MKKMGAFMCLLVLISAGVWLDSASRPVVLRPLSPQAAILTNEFARASAALQKGDYPGALERFRAGYREAQRVGQVELAGRFLWGIGNCQFARRRYEEAVREYLAARDLFRDKGDWSSVSALNGNLSSLYQQLGDFDAAITSARLALAQAAGVDRNGRRARLMILLGGLLADAGKIDESRELMKAGVIEADRFDDPELLANAWDRLGSELLGWKELSEAESALLEGYRIRKLNRLPSLAASYGNLGLLRFEQGDLRSAKALLDASVDKSKIPSNRTPAWRLYYVRGRLHLSEGRFAQAYADFKSALEFARDDRIMTPAADSTRVSLEVSLRNVYASFIETALHLYGQTGRPDLASEAFEAMEENRGGSLAARLNERSQFQGRMTPAYRDALSDLRLAESAAFMTNDEAPREQMRRIRGTILEMEAKAGVTRPRDRQDLLARLQRSLDRESAVLLSFHLGEQSSWMWAVDGSKLATYRLPGRETVLAGARRFRQAIVSRDHSSKRLGRDLYRTLFGKLGADYTDKSRWLLSLDEGMSELPFAALVTDGDDSVYLIERHSLQIVSGAANWLETSKRVRVGGSFVGIGDAVYNTADSRWRGRKPTRGWLEAQFGWPWRASAAPGSTLGLSRLAGSGLEVEASARAWRSQSVLLEGPAVTRENIRRLVETHPAVVHIAAHVVRDPQRATNALIALSLSDRGQDEFLVPAEISGWNVDAGLVVLSGCSSGAAVSLPGAGLMGMTRAWLMAGADAVVATLWPTPDDVGVFFRGFYQELQRSESHNPADALRAAQIEMIESVDWRSQPDYWAAYFTLGND